MSKNGFSNILILGFAAAALVFIESGSRNRMRPSRVGAARARQRRGNLRLVASNGRIIPSLALVPPYINSLR